MTLKLQINLIVGALTLVLVGATLTLQLRSLRLSVQEEVVAANRVASQLLDRTAWRDSAQGPQAMLAFLQGVGRVRSNDIALFDADGRVLYRSPPSPYKAGRDAPGWFERAIVPPPSLRAIDFPGGRLELRANASRAAIDAWDEMRALAAGAALLLATTQALVLWLVDRAVRPFGRIVGALEALQAGRFDVSLPPLAGAEAGAIGAAFNRMVGELGAHLDTRRRLSDSRELSRWVAGRVERERRLIARELHDELGQSVTAMRSMALSIAQRVAGFDAQAERAARLIADESSRLYDAMHGIIPRLAPLVLDAFGLADALADLVERTRRSQPGATIGLELGLGGAAVDGDTALALYRAAQEGVTNALRHGRARRIDLALVATGGTIRLSVADDGAGLAADALQRPGHHGLRWLTERVEALGGRVAIGPRAPGGVELRVEVPAPSADAARADATAVSATATATAPATA